MPRFRPMLPLKRAGRRDRIHPSTPSFPAIHQSANAWPRLACCHLPLPRPASDDRTSYSTTYAPVCRHYCHYQRCIIAPNRLSEAFRHVASGAEVECSTHYTASHVVSPHSAPSLPSPFTLPTSPLLIAPRDTRPLSHSNLRRSLPPLTSNAITARCDRAMYLRYRRYRALTHDRLFRSGGAGAVLRPDYS